MVDNFFLGHPYVFKYFGDSPFAEQIEESLQMIEKYRVPKDWQQNENDKKEIFFSKKVEESKKDIEKYGLPKKILD